MWIDEKARALHIKVVYEGPISCGKSTCLEYLHTKLRPELCSKLFKLYHCGLDEKIVFFDFIPRTLPPIRGLQIRVQFQTVTGTDVYPSTHPDLLKAADALMFVADSQRAQSAANVENRALVETLIAQGVAARSELPWLFSYNKRDLPDVLSVPEMAAQLNPGERHPSVATIATRGDGVFEAMKALVTSTVAAIRVELEEPDAVH